MQRTVASIAVAIVALLGSTTITQEDSTSMTLRQLSTRRLLVGDEEEEELILPVGVWANYLNKVNGVTIDYVEPAAAP
jgi:hypothetical protein